MDEPGTFILVVGPSGVGKDTLLGGARRALAPQGRFEFPARVIDRDPGYGGERHEPVTTAGFDALVRDERLSLWWRAHGHHYGIRDEVDGLIERGVHVVANVSRSVLDRARSRFPRVRVVSVRAPAEVLRARLLGRGREAPEELGSRLAAHRTEAPRGPDVSEFVNELPVEASRAAFVNHIVALVR